MRLLLLDPLDRLGSGGGGLEDRLRLVGKKLAPALHISGVVLVGFDLDADDLAQHRRADFSDQLLACPLDSGSGIVRDGVAVEP